MNILRIDASARDVSSISRSLLNAFFAQLGDAVSVRSRDLNESLPHVSKAWVEANTSPEAERTDQQKRQLALSDALVGELEAADLIVIGLPVYNFGVPAAFKAWVDQVCRARKTFTYSESGPVGLLKNKRAIVVYVSGGTEMGSNIDFASGFVRHILGFIGIEDVTFIAADRHMMDDQAIARATRELDALARDIVPVTA